MPYGLKLSVHSEVEKTVYAGTHGYASGIVMRGPECAEHLTFYIFDLTGIRIVDFLCISEEPVHSVSHTWRQIDVFEQCEVWQADLKIMGHTILELVPESGLVEFGSLEIDSVLKRGVISKRELLIPLFLADSVLQFERIEAGYRKCDVRKSERI